MTHKRGSQLETRRSSERQVGVSPEFGASLVYKVSSTSLGYLKKKKKEDIWGELRARGCQLTPWYFSPNWKARRRGLASSSVDTITLWGCWSFLAPVKQQSQCRKVHRYKNCQHTRISVQHLLQAYVFWHNPGSNPEAIRRTEHTKNPLHPCLGTGFWWERVMEYNGLWVIRDWLVRSGEFPKIHLCF